MPGPEGPAGDRSPATAHPLGADCSRHRSSSHSAGRACGRPTPPKSLPTQRQRPPARRSAWASWLGGMLAVQCPIQRPSATASAVRSVPCLFVCNCSPAPTPCAPVPVPVRGGVARTGGNVSARARARVGARARRSKTHRRQQKPAALLLTVAQAAAAERSPGIYAVLARPVSAVVGMDAQVCTYCSRHDLLCWRPKDTRRRRTRFRLFRFSSHA